MKIITQLGSGSYGTVYKIFDEEKKEYRALKKFKKTFSSLDDCKDEPEASLLPKLNHPNIIKLDKVMFDKGNLFLIMELVTFNLGQFLTKLYQKKQRLTDSQIAKMIKQLLNALQYLHKKGYMHRDIKSENILVTEGEDIKLTDFGTAKIEKSKNPHTSYVSTRWYRAPECILGSTKYDRSIDVFAAGGIMAELYHLGPVFGGNSNVDQMDKYGKYLGTRDIKDWKEGKEMADKMNYKFPDNDKGLLELKLPNAPPEGKINSC